MIQQTARKYIGIEELAAYLAISKNTVRAWVWQRQIPYFKVGRLIRFDTREIDSWLLEKKKSVID